MLECKSDESFQYLILPRITLEVSHVSSSLTLVKAYHKWSLYCVVSFIRLGHDRSVSTLSLSTCSSASDIGYIIQNSEQLCKPSRA